MGFVNPPHTVLVPATVFRRDIAFKFTTGRVFRTILIAADGLPVPVMSPVAHALLLRVQTVPYQKVRRPDSARFKIGGDTINHIVINLESGE